jgi:hypothetical protein
VQQTHGRSQLRRYGPEIQHALFLAWHDANHICAKRLIPFLPTLIEALERHEHLHLTEECRRQLLSMSATTAERLLRSQRKKNQRGLSTTQAGILLKQQIPIRTFHSWKETRERLCWLLETSVQENGDMDRHVPLFLSPAQREASLLEGMFRTAKPTRFQLDIPM